MAVSWPFQQSGETKDVLRCVQKAMGHDVTALSVVNSVGSIIARTTKLGVYFNAGRENAVASTKAFTTQVTVMALLACWFHDLRNENHSPKFEQLMASLHRLPISFGMGLRLQEQCRGGPNGLLKQNISSSWARATRNRSPREGRPEDQGVRVRARRGAQWRRHEARALRAHLRRSGEEDAYYYADFG